MAGLDDPAPGPPLGVLAFSLDLLAAGADVGLEALAPGELADVVEVVAAIEAEPLRLRLGRDRPPDRNRGEGRL